MTHRVGRSLRSPSVAGTAVLVLAILGGGVAGAGPLAGAAASGAREAGPAVPWFAPSFFLATVPSGLPRVTVPDSNFVQTTDTRYESTDFGSPRYWIPIVSRPAGFGSTEIGVR